MNRLYCLLLALVFVSSVPAQEDPKTQFEFMQGLRDKGYYDLAAEQLEKLRGMKIPALESILPLESARLQLAIARDKPAEQRAPYFVQARKEFEAYAKANAGKPEEARVRLELAQLMGFQAEATLNKAMREASTAAQHEKARPAEKQFIQAGIEIEQAAKALEELASSYKNPDPKEEKLVRQQLVKDYWQARLEAASNYLDQARTYIDQGKTAVLKARTGKVVEAKKRFESIATESKDASVQYLAMAWFGKCCQETDEPDRARKYYDLVLTAKDKAAQPGQRLVRYFDIQNTMGNPKLAKLAEKDKQAQIQKLALAWIKDYPTALKTPEGYGVQFELAQSLYREGEALWGVAIQKEIAKLKDKDDEKAKEVAKTVPPPKPAIELFERAQKYYDIVAKGDNDFTERANQKSITISFQKIGEGTPLSALRDFDQSFLKAQFELMKMNQAMQAAEKDPGKAAAHDRERLNRLKQAGKALRQALMLADTRTPPSKVDEARFFLATAYLFSGDLERAAVMGEFLARLKPATKRSSYGAAYALEAYGQMLGRENTQEIRLRLRDLANYILSDEAQKTWSDDPVTHVARFQLAFSFMRDQDAEGRKPYQQAIEQLEKIPPDFPGYLVAQAQLGFLAREAAEQKDIDPKRREAYTKAARAAFGRIKDLPPDPDTGVATMYFAAKLEGAKFLYEDAANLLQKKQLPAAAKNYQEMSKFIDDLQGQLEKQPPGLIKEGRDNLEFTMNVLKKYALFGLAEVDYRLGNYKEVLSPAKTGSVLKQVLAMKPDGGGKIRLKDFQVTTELLALALRAQVQMGSIKEAKNTLRVMESLAGEAGDLGAGMTNVLRELVVDLQTQVRELKAAGDPKKLKETVGNFSIFLDDLANKKGASLNDLTFLASCFASLEQYDRAANLFRKLDPPALLKADLKGKKLTDEEEQQLYGYWRIRIEFAKTLRLGKVDLKEAEQVLDELLNHPNGRFHLMARRERYLVYEDTGRFGLAIKGWTEIMNDPFLKGQLPVDNKLGILFGKKAKDIYFDAYYHYGYSVYQYGQSDAGKKAGVTARYTDFAAKHFFKLKSAASQEGWQIIEQQFNELRASAEPLRTAFDAMVEKSKKTASAK